MNCVVIFKVQDEIHWTYCNGSSGELMDSIEEYSLFEGGDFIIVDVIGGITDWLPYKDLFIKKYGDQLQ